MNKRARICIYIFLICVFAALGVVGYFILGRYNDNVMVAPKFFTFIEVPDAESYTLTASKKEDNLNFITANCKISKQETENPNEYIYNNTVTDENGTKLVEQTYNQIITNEDEFGGTIDCKIYNYTLTLFNDGDENLTVYKYPDRELKNINENTICCLIAEYFGNLFNEDGKYNINFVAVNSDGQDIESTRKNYSFDYVACFENEFKKREDFYINGNWCNYIITCEEDLELLVWHSILYRQNDVRFYVKTNDINKNNINNLVIDFINSYPEYDGIYSNSYNLYATMDGNNGKLINFNYFLDFNFTKNYKFLAQKYGYIASEAEELVQTKGKDFNPLYITAEDDESNTGTNRQLYIDDPNSELDEVVVYNTEQLFMVVQYGAKPIIADETSVVATVYKNAKNILLEINNSNNLTPYEKALNIYRYICGNVIYDHAIIRYMEKLKNSYISTFGNINCFYLEGALLDLNNQYAVCDGLSKTFCLLTNLEGIDCVKINGSTSRGNHAWNKINIEDAKYKLSGWYPVDTTWGVEDDDKTEITTHTYFLRLGNETRNVAFDPISEKQQNVDYYKLAKYSYNGFVRDFNISSDAELSDLINYAKHTLETTSSNQIVIEFKLEKTIGYSYFDSIKEFDNYPVITERANTVDDNFKHYFGWLDRRVNMDINNYCYDALFVGNVVVLKISKLPVAETINVLQPQLNYSLALIA